MYKRTNQPLASMPVLIGESHRLTANELGSQLGAIVDRAWAPRDSIGVLLPESAARLSAIDLAASPTSNFSQPYIRRLFACHHLHV